MRVCGPSDELGRHQLCCDKCGLVSSLTRSPPERYFHDCNVSRVILQAGPGTELKKLLASLGIVELPGCDCAVKVLQMNRWGPAGCRDNIETIYGWMEEGQTRGSWFDKISTAVAALRSGLAFELDPSRPLRSLVDLAIERAT